MSKQQTAHIISHTHWDREWYLPYEQHHIRLVRLVDSLLDRLEQDLEFKSFFFDGQTIIIEDYLQVRPENRERLERHIREGRIFIGPWYILQDAFLTSAEANVRNMQIGHKDAKVYGPVSKIGYFPDTFGLTGQIPQLMAQAGISNAFFGRGVKPTGFNNTVSDDGYESSFSELLWEGPDGSKVLGILFANWYSNGNEIPVDPDEAKAFWERKLADAGKFAATNQLLFMNGCDHQPLQLDLPEAIRTAEKLYPEIRFVHSSFADYVQAVESYTKDFQGLSTVKGELRSQRTDGWGTLVNTASARIYLKQLNQRGQALLEKVAEPLAAMAKLHGGEYPHHLFTYAWKTLMQNHPHDSICGCSVDEVHREMVTRFDKSRHVAEGIVTASMDSIAGAVDTGVFAKFGEDALPLIVANTSGWSRAGTVSVELDAARLYLREGLPLEETARRMKAVDLGGRILVNEQGTAIACTVQDLGLSFGYDLPDDRFRQPYMCRKVKLTFEAADVPALGLRAYAWVRLNAGADGAASSTAIHEAMGSTHAETMVSLHQGQPVLENGTLRVEIMADGSFVLDHKPSGKTYRDLGIYENTGDIGNEYMFRQPDGETPLTTRGLSAQINIIEDTPYRASVEIAQEWEIPASADALLEDEQRSLVYYPERQAQRSAATVKLKLRTVLRLERNGKGVKIEAFINNTAQDHRLRMLFPTDLAAATHRADSMFELAERPNEPAPEWLNPSNTQHQQAFVDVAEEGAGFAVANLGLNEYEILRDGRNTIAVTLLRCVGELGDWGWFPTPEAQCLGEHTAEMLLLPHDGNVVSSGAAAAAYQFQIPWVCARAEVHAGIIPAAYSPVSWSGKTAALSSLTINEDSGDLMIRWFNLEDKPCDLQVDTDIPHAGFYKSNILEEKAAVLEHGNTAAMELLMGGHEIVTVGIVTGGEQIY